jgi:hypothetical protein
MLLRALPLCAALFFLAGLTWAAEPTYEYTLKKGDDSIAAAKDGDKTVFTIVGKSGIGGGTIALKDGDWSKEVVLRFQYGKTDAFKTLEKFTLTTAHVKVEGAQKQSKAMPFFLAGSDGKFGATPAGTLEIVVEGTKDGLDVRLPANLLAGSKKVELSWIDAYR